MKIDAPSLDELREELVANYKELVSDIFLLECLIQHGKEAFVVVGAYSDENRGLALCRVVDYIEQHVKDIYTVSVGIRKLLCGWEAERSANLASQSPLACYRRIDDGAFE